MKTNPYLSPQMRCFDVRMAKDILVTSNEINGTGAAVGYEEDEQQW